MKIRGLGDIDHERDVRNAIVGLVKNGEDGLGMQVVAGDVMDRGNPSLLVVVGEDEGEAGTGGMFLVSVDRISPATMESGGVFGG